jgi:aspartate aminotransferase
VIAPDLEALLEPLERFESIRRRAVRLGDRLCDLSYANPYEGTPRAAREAIRQALDDERLLDLQYSPFGGQTLARRAVADSLRESHDLPFAAGDVVLTPGAMSALHLALRAAAAPGDEVVIPVPCWLDLPLYARFLGLEPKLVPLAEESFDLDIGAISEALSSRTAALVLAHPANPTGRCYSPEALSRLGEELREAEQRLDRRLTLVSDEVHRDFVPEEDAYSSAARFVERTVVVYSFGKYHFMQGQRLGYAAVSPRHPERGAVADEMVRWTRITGVATPTALMQRALPALLGLRHDLTWVGAWRARLLEVLSGGGYAVTEPDATLFVYARTPPGYEDDFAFVEELARGGVLALPAPVFHHRGYFRLSLTASEAALERALPVLEQVAAR